LIEVDVIIPFFQREFGILRQALVSVLAQQLAPGIVVNVIVVDDGSPVPARDEVAGLAFTDPFRLTLVEQANQGCGGARDAGLRAVGDAARYIAFLDSDDTWSPDHIASAVGALESGYDIYFTDHSRTGNHESFFKNINFPPPDAGPPQVINLRDDIWSIDRDLYYHFSLRRLTAQISTFVYRRSIYPDAKFETSLKAAAEDCIFMLQTTRRASKICFRKHQSIVCGRGINIYYSTFGWDDEGHLRRYMADVLGGRALLKALDLQGADRKVIEDRIALYKNSFAFFTMRWFLQRRGSWSKDLRELTASDPTFRVWYPRAVLAVGVRYPLGMYKAEYHDATAD
jgi:succinoglycan biosynthesis protein ExoW